MKLSNLFVYFNKFDFEIKTKFLIFIISGGMFTIVILSLISTFSIKHDFDKLFEQRTTLFVKLENMKDAYKVNIQDTLIDVENKSITLADSKEVITLAKQLINSNWYEYKQETYNSNIPLVYLTKFIKQFIQPPISNEKNQILKINIMNNVDKKILLINEILSRIKEKNIKSDFSNLYLEINAVNIYITSLINYDLSLAISEKRETQQVFNIIIIGSVISIILVFVFSIVLSIILINNFRHLHKMLEVNIKNKTKELKRLNNSLEKRVIQEVTNNRKKDIIMFQQAKLASLGEMLNNIAHQWRQPLSSITMIIQGFQTKMFMGKLTHEYLETKVNDALLLANNMSNTLEDFKNFFSPDKAKSKFYVHDCVEHTVELSKYLLDKQKICLKLEIRCDIELNTYYNELSHVFLNIIANSKDALATTTIKHAKMIKIIISKYKNYAIIHFIDNGGGIDEDIIEQIFEPYYTTKYKSAGTGIGLYMSKQIIEKHMDGFINCKNIYHKIDDIHNDKCSLFIIKIPIKDIENDGK
jgi:signal transduction histidine kinase